jgi:LEA14-like dessication related protein
MLRRWLLVSIATCALAACASLSGSDPLHVTVSGIDPLDGQGLELRMLVKLRVQNPNTEPVDFSGVYVKIDVQGKTLATGVSDEHGVVPGFGESVIAVPVTISAMSMVRQVMGVIDGQAPGKLTYDLSGKLSGSGFSAVRFQSQGELSLPGTGSAN